LNLKINESEYILAVYTKLIKNGYFQTVIETMLLARILPKIIAPQYRCFSPRACKINTCSNNCLAYRFSRSIPDGNDCFATCN